MTQQLSLDRNLESESIPGPPATGRAQSQSEDRRAGRDARVLWVVGVPGRLVLGRVVGGGHAAAAAAREGTGRGGSTDGQRPAAGLRGDRPPRSGGLRADLARQRPGPPRGRALCPHHRLSEALAGGHRRPGQGRPAARRDQRPGRGRPTRPGPGQPRPGQGQPGGVRGQPRTGEDHLYARQLAAGTGDFAADRSTRTWPR